MQSTLLSCRHFVSEPVHLHTRPLRAPTRLPIYLTCANRGNVQVEEIHVRHVRPHSCHWCLGGHNPRPPPCGSYGAPGTLHCAPDADPSSLYYYFPMPCKNNFSLIPYSGGVFLRCFVAKPPAHPCCFVSVHWNR
ncbi:unnamed protein product, partial [Discosporangium mesarthrocarpum]